MAMAQLEKKEIIFIAIVLTVILGGLWFYHGRTFFDIQHGYDGKVISVNEKNIAKKQSAEKRRIEQQFAQSFEGSLNSFLRIVAEEMTEYKKRRKVVESALNPQNLKTPAYIQQNFELLKTAIPDLQNRSFRIVKAFEDKDKEIKKLVSNRSPEGQRRILQTWETVKSQRGQLFMNYFAIEQDLLGSYEALMYLYHQNSNNLSYNAKNNTLSSSSDDVNEKIVQIQTTINQLKGRQRNLSR